MKHFILIIFLSVFTLAGPVPTIAETENKDSKIIKVDVHGMVCDFCARALEKVFARQDKVNKIDVSLEDKLVKIYLKQGQDMSDDKVEELVNDAGYAMAGIRR